MLTTKKSISLDLPSSTKSAERIKHWSYDKKDPAGNSLSIHEAPSTLFDTCLFIGMLFGVFGVVIQMKILAWTSMLLSLHCLGQYRGQEDFRQIGTSFIISISALGMLYTRNPAPME